VSDGFAQPDLDTLMANWSCLEHGPHRSLLSRFGTEPFNESGRLETFEGSVDERSWNHPDLADLGGALQLSSGREAVSRFFVDEAEHDRLRK
jgi:hypothetical protein